MIGRRNFVKSPGKMQMNEPGHSHGVKVHTTGGCFLSRIMDNSLDVSEKKKNA
jgi:hypothetical protein